MAYNFLPTNAADIQKKYKSKKQDQVSDIIQLYGFLRELDKNTKDPLALDPSKTTTVKIIRSLMGKMKDIEKKFSLKFDNKGTAKKNGVTYTFGNGSRGNMGTANRGNLFEVKLVDDLNLYLAEGSTAKFQYPEFMKEFPKLIGMDKTKDVQILAEGALNQKRPLKFDAEGAYFGSRNYDIGSTVTDVTVVVGGKKHYLSLKLGSTVTLFNIGVGTILGEKILTKGADAIPENGLRLLKSLKIDPQRFANQFNYYQKADVFKLERMDVPFTADSSVEAMLKSGIGYGYWLIHEHRGKIHYEYISKSDMPLYTKPIGGSIIKYPDNSAKRIDIIIETRRLTYKLNIRNKQGGLYPSHLLGDYKFK